MISILNKYCYMVLRGAFLSLDEPYRFYAESSGVTTMKRSMYFFLT